MKLKSNFGFEPTFAMLEEAYSCSYDKEQRDILRLGFDKGLDISRCANPRYEWTIMKEVLYGLNNGVDISRHLDFDTTEERAQLIRAGRERNLDVSRYESRKLTQEEAKKIYYELLDEKILNHKRKRMTKVQLENEIIEQRFRNCN